MLKNDKSKCSLYHTLKDCQQSSHVGFRELHGNVRTRCLSFPFSSKFCTCWLQPGLYLISHPSPPSHSTILVFPPKPSYFIFRKCQQVDLCNIIAVVFFPGFIFRYSLMSISSLRARKLSLIMPATTNYNIKFLKCKCILENYSALGSPLPPLTTPRHENQEELS